jgi:Ca2+-binding RTX toxin-like protein
LNATDATYYFKNYLLEVNFGSLANATQFQYMLAHEIYGHDGTRDFIATVVDPNNSIYQNKTPEETRNLVGIGCYTVEALGFIAEYKISQETGFSRPIYPIGVEEKIKAAYADIYQFLSADTDPRVVDLAVAQYIATWAQKNDGSHASQCLSWANEISNASGNSGDINLANMFTEYSGLSGESALNLETPLFQVDSFFLADGTWQSTVNLPNGDQIKSVDTNGDGQWDQIQTSTELTPGITQIVNDLNADGVDDQTLYTIDGITRDISNFDDLLAVDYIFQAQQTLISQLDYNAFTQNISNLLVGSTNLFGNPVPDNPYNYTPIGYNPIGAFYDSKTPTADPASSIAALTPVILDANKKAMSAASLAALDANHDGTLSAAELASLGAWSDLDEDGVMDVGEWKTLAQQGITQIKAADYGFYTAGNARMAETPPVAPTQQADTTGLPASVAQRAVQTQPTAPAGAPAVPVSAYRTLRDTDNRYMINATQWIDWTAAQVKISSDKKNLVGTDGNDNFDVNYWAAYSQYFNINLIENFYAGNGNDVMGGSARNDKLWGGTGNDTLMGYTGDDSIYGEEGADQLQGGAGNDVLDGGIDNDVLFGETGNDTMNGGEGDDTLVGGSSSVEAAQTLGVGETDDDRIYEIGRAHV